VKKWFVMIKKLFSS